MPETALTATAPQPGIVAPLSVKAMVPEKAVLPCAAADTVAVKITGVLKVALDGLAVRVAVVPVAPTVCTTVFELELKFGSPLYATVMVCELMASPEYEHVTTPLAEGVVAGQLVIAVAEPPWGVSVMLTLPARATPPEGAETVLVKVTDWLNDEGFGAAVTAMLLVAGVMVTAVPNVAFALPKLVSPV